MKRGLGFSLLTAAVLLAAVVLTRSGNSSSVAPRQEPGYQFTLRPVAVSVVAVSRQPLDATVDFTGSLLPRRATRVFSEVDGIVREIPQVGPQFDVVSGDKTYSERLGVGYGQDVRLDDVLVQLDTRDAEVALQIAQAKLRKVEADLAKLRSWERPEQVTRFTALRDEANARYENALLHYRRTEALVQQRAGSAREYEEAATAVATTRAALESAEAVLAQALAGPTAEELAVQQALVAQAEAEVQQHRRQIEKSTIRAPYGGVITAFGVEVGDRVSPGATAVAELVDPSYLIAEIAVPESYVGRVQLRDRATLRIAGSDTPVPGLVTAVNEMVDLQTRTFQVRVAIDNHERRFKAGQFSTVTLALGGREVERLAVPTAAIVYLQGEPHVFTFQEDRVRLTPVTLGVANGDATEIVHGVEPGQQVVVDDPALLADGMQVALRDHSALSASAQ